MTFDPFDVVVVPFPFTDRAATKRRPALVVSSTGFSAAHPQSILAMITSAAGTWASDIHLRNWRDAGLNVSCRVRMKLFTLDNSLIVRRVGSLSQVDSEATKRALARALAVTGPAIADRERRVRPEPR